ncbi:PLP-dependent aminotransferase family protein [Tissierella sp. Yu-01]|uniref:MocR-like pyridoxine biosynthesis transcription factor PdxR n=1 Tax=Tissierella sp. Yu-01 TaxID=3035694 RepID=UPI00240E0AB4|nr:PLP-dependent aminotransferase family protein [Tissierella sp. Yu-01]WFA08335.1 PLP-dependent aminotransferase family protein [Tissierella sp. Yu-01]
MKELVLDKSSNEPLYIQLYKQIRDQIEKNELLDEKLPSIRKLSKQLGVNNVTIINTYKLLEQEGYVYSVEGSGTYVKKISLSEEITFLDDGDMDLMLSGILPIHKDSINFASVSPTPDLFPIKEFKQALIEVLDRDGGLAFLYPEINGYEPLRESISKFLKLNYTINANMDQILITSGGQQGLDIIAKSMVNQGDVIIVENPTYSAAYEAFKSRGAKIIGIPMEDDGIHMETLKATIKRHNPKFLYIMTNYQSPTTYSYSREKKLEVLNLAKENDFYIIEDDFLTDLYFDNDIKTPLKSLDELDKVIFIKSFSKIFMPGVRIGFITLPNRLLKGIIKAKHTTDISSSGYLQRAFDLYLRKGYWKSHIANIRNVYSDKYNIMIKELSILKKYGIEYTEPNGGLSIWLKLPDTIDSIQLYKECLENNLSLVPGKVFFINNDINANFLRISFGGVSNSQIIKGIGILDNILSKPFKNENNEYMPFV